MQNSNSLQRFIDAQQVKYGSAYNELSACKKQSHWMWFIFPQLRGIGLSDTAHYYGIADLAEATSFLQRELLGERLVNICKLLINLPSKNATEIFGYPDDHKLQSSMTLFSQVPQSDPVFEAVLDKFFDGRKDPKTIALLQP